MSDTRYDPPPRGDMARGDGASLSGLTEAEAKEFHGMFVTSFMAFLVVAIIAHILTYVFGKPWGI